MKVSQKPPSARGLLRFIFLTYFIRSRQGWKVRTLQTGKAFMDSLPFLPTSIGQKLTSCSRNGSVCMRNTQRNFLTTAMPSGASARISPLANPPASLRLAGGLVIQEHANTSQDLSLIDAQPMANLTLSDSTHPKSRSSTSMWYMVCAGSKARTMTPLSSKLTAFLLITSPTLWTTTTWISRMSSEVPYVVFAHQTALWTQNQADGT